MLFRSMVCLKVLGNDTTISAAASQGNYQLNVFMPVIIRDFLESCKLMTDAMLSFEKNCARGIRPDTEKIKENLDKSLMPVTALSPHIGYEKAAEIAKKAYTEGIILKEAVKLLGTVSDDDFDRWVDPEKMV